MNYNGEMKRVSLENVIHVKHPDALTVFRCHVIVYGNVTPQYINPVFQCNPMYAIIVNCLLIS